jgi:2-haloacid dehalogenase
VIRRTTAAGRRDNGDRLGPPASGRKVSLVDAGPGRAPVLSIRLAMRDTPAMRDRSSSSPSQSVPTPDRPTAVVFDLGGVLIDWNPRYLYRSLFDDEAAMERFLAEVTTQAWNLEQDRGRPFAEAVAALVREHPEEAERIEAYWRRWPEMLGDAHADVVAILAELRATSVRLLAMTNWSAETFPLAIPRFPFLDWFEGVIVSGQERLVKPDPAIFRLLVDRHGVEPARTVFIDDAAVNVRAAESFGFRAIRFTDAPALRRGLELLGLLDAPAAESRARRRDPA